MVRIKIDKNASVAYKNTIYATAGVITLAVALTVGFGLYLYGGWVAIFSALAITLRHATTNADGTVNITGLIHDEGTHRLVCIIISIIGVYHVVDYLKSVMQ